MPVTSSNFAKLLDPGIRAIYGETYKQYPEEYTQIFNVENSTKAYEDSLSMTGFGAVPEKPAGSAVAYDMPIQGPSRRQTHLTYGLGFVVTEEMFEDDLYRKIRALPAALSRSVRHTIETVAANVLNNAFSSSYTGADGKELCATDHPLLGGGTQANELATAADFDMTSLEQALIDIAGLTDDRGILVNARPVRLVIPPELEFQAKRILKSTMDPESANNSINPLSGMLPKGYVVNHYLTDPDAWFIQTDIPNGMTFYWRRKPTFTRDNEFQTDNALWKTTMRFSVGWDNHLSIFGSPGA